MANSSISIAGRKIGPSHPPYIIAEMSGNHNGKLDRAMAIIEAAKEAGADAVKLQTYTADTLTIDHDGPGFRIEGGLWDGHRLYELYKEAHTPWEWHESLFAKGRELGICVFSTPFDVTALDFLETLDAPAHKVASFEMIDLPLVGKIAQKGKPMVISTGIANKTEISETVATVRQNGCNDIVLLHCVSGYPSRPDDANLRTIEDLARSFDVVAGLSDHTHGTAVSIAAVALGASLIEKHFTLSRADGGPDSAFSLEPDELAELVSGCNIAWRALGKADYEPKQSEKGNDVFRRSLYVVADVKAGEVFSPLNVRSIRPGHGLAPKHLPDILGLRAAHDIKRGEPLTWDMVQK